MKGTLSHEVEVDLPAGEVWAVYGTIRLAEVVVQVLPNILEKFEIVEGDGGAGTVLHLSFPSGYPGPKFYREKFTKIDNEKRMKEATVVEGGYLELGFKSYMVRFEIVEKDSTSSVIRSTIEYEISDELAGNASLITVDPLAAIAEAVSKYLIDNKNGV